MVEELIVHNEEKHMNSVKDVLNLKFMQAAIPIKKQMEVINEFREAVQNELDALTAQADKVHTMVKQFAVYGDQKLKSRPDISGGLEGPVQPFRQKSVGFHRYRWDYTQHIFDR